MARFRRDLHNPAWRVIVVLAGLYVISYYLPRADQHASGMILGYLLRYLVR